jgi:hypothetical protein
MMNEGMKGTENGIREKQREVVQGQHLTQQETLRPRSPLVEEELKRRGFSECKKSRRHDIAVHMQKLLETRKWEQATGLFRGLQGAIFYEQDYLEKQIRNAVEQARRDGEFETVVDLLQILINLPTRKDQEKKMLKKEIKQYIRLIDALADPEKEIKTSLLTPEMWIIDCIVEGNFQKLPDISEKTGIEASTILEILEYVNHDLNLFKEKQQLSFSQIEKESKLGRYLARFLVKRWISTERLKVM